MNLSRALLWPSGVKAAPHEQQRHDVRRSLVSLFRNQNDIDTTAA